jgi:Na+/H+ antiporter NhaC
MVKKPLPKYVPPWSLAVLFCLVLTAAWIGSLITHSGGSTTSTTTIHASSWTSILPPLLAIVFALISRQVMLALFLGVWLGAFLVGPPGWTRLMASFFRALSEYIVPAVAERDHASIIIFSLLIGGMIGVITENGGMNGVVERISRYITTRRGGQLATSFFGLLIFFDDYSNTMIVGNAMRALTDKLRISRAKLAYLVDSTAAPVATVALVSTWIGAMVAYIAEAETFMENYAESAYLVFVNSLPYNFYAFFTLFFVMVIAATDKDFGAMLKARRRLATSQEPVGPDKYDFYKIGDPTNPFLVRTAHWSNAAVPISILIAGTLVGLWVTGEGTTVQEIIGTADSYAALLWASLLALFVAGLLTHFNRLLNAEQTMRGIRSGMHLMFDGLMILVLAWSISTVTKELGTANYLVSVLHDILNPFWTPMVIFILAALISFATGSSWGTMGILMPLVVPLVWNTGIANHLPMAETHSLIFGSVSSVLAGSVWGDHCSPISDTTILSSSASHCNHIEHVRTQLPYALVVGVVSVISLIAAFVWEIPVWIIYPVGFAVLFAIIYRFGRSPETEPVDSTPES